MTLYKCKYCTHEEDYQHHPSECPICGKSSLMVIEGKLKTLLKEEAGKCISNMNNEFFTTHGVWGTYEALLNKDKNSFQNPFDYDLWILVIEISHLSPNLSHNTIRLEGKYNLYTNIISSTPTSSTNSYPHWANNQIKVEACEHPISGRSFGQYVFWRKGEELRIESKIGNFIRVTGQLIHSQYF